MGESETPGRLRGRPILWFALPMAVLVFVGASTPWIAQRVPRFLFPALAALSFITSDDRGATVIQTLLYVSYAAAFWLPTGK